MENNFNEGDIFRWSYNDEMLKKLNHGQNGGTTYWCLSQIGIVKNGMLVDTYWTSGNNSSFARDVCEQKLVLKFIANINDLVKAEPSDRAYYLDDDCIDLNHPNSTRGNFYIKKGAEKNIEKMTRILNRKKLELDKKLKQIEWEIKLVDKDILSINIETYISTTKDLCLNDNSYQDEQ